MSAQEMTALVDGLVAEARASRDSAFNALHAVERESQRATERLAAQVTRFMGVHERSMAAVLRLEVPRLQAELAEQAEAETTPDEAAAAPAHERDTRFDPEDEWVPEPAPRHPGSTPPAPPGRRFEEDEDDSEAWQR